MNNKLFLLAFAFFVLSSLLSGDHIPLQAPAAPFKPTVASVTENNLSAPEFNAGAASIIFGNKEFQLKNNTTLYYLSDGRRIAEFRLGFFIPSNNRWLAPPRNPVIPFGGSSKEFGIENFVADKNSSSFKIIGLIPHAEGETEQFTYILRLLPDNKLELILETSPEQLKNSGIFCWMTNCSGLVADGQSIDFKQKGKISVKNPRQIRSNADNPVDDFSVSPIGEFYQFWTRIPHSNGFRLTPAKNTVRYHLIIDPLKYGATKSDANLANLKKLDNLDMPAVGKNLLQNPYFAQGKYFYDYVNSSTPFNDHVWQLTTRNPKFGKYALETDQRSEWLLTNAAPALPGQYAFSIYARGKGSIRVCMRNQHSRNISDFTWDLNSPDQWMRFEQTFSNPANNALTPWFFIVPADSSVVTLDGLQLEKGAKATEFSASPLSARLITNPSGGFLESGKPAEVKLELSTLESNVSGKATAEIRDFFGNPVWHSSFNFNFGNKQYPEINLNLDRNLYDGIHVLYLDYLLSDGQKHREQFRISVMPFFSNKHKISRLFSPQYFSFERLDDAYPGLEAFLQRCARIGVGIESHSSFKTPEAVKLYEKYDIIPLDAGLCERRATTEQLKKVFPGTNPEPGLLYFFVRNAVPRARLYEFNRNDFLLPDYELVGGWSPEYRQKFIDAVKTAISKYPPKMLYGIGSEWPRNIKDRPDYIELFLAYREAVKSVYPQSEVCEFGGTNMDVRGGTQQLADFLARLAGRCRLEYFSAHPYTTDITAIYPNFKAFKETLDRFGYSSAKMIFPEGMHYCPYAIDQWNCELISWNENTWRGGPLSYAVGWSEMLSTAYFMRCYLIYLTEFERVFGACSGAVNTRNFAVDMEMIPRGFQKVPNTLGALLGNPKRFVGDCSFEPESICLVWEDENGCPIAAVWNESRTVNAGVEDSPIAVSNLRNAEYFDMMGVKRTPLVDGEFPVSPFPFFIRGQAGTTEDFVKTLSSAGYRNRNKNPLKISSSLIGTNKIELQAVNPLSRNFHGTWVIGKQKISVNLQAGETKTFTLPLSNPVKADEVTGINSRFKLISENKEFESSFERRALAVKYFTGNWNDIPSLSFTSKVVSVNNEEVKGYPGDLDGRYQLAWDEKALHIRVAVQDDVFTHTEYSEGGKRWNNDCLQIYFDTRGRAPESNQPGHDKDDYIYWVLPDQAGNSARTFRQISPDPQLTLGVAAPKDHTFADDIPSRFTRTDDGYIYEISIPSQYILPAELKQNETIGFGLYVADRDHGKQVKQGLSTNPNGQGCFQKPQDYPLMLLVK